MARVVRPSSDATSWIRRSRGATSVSWVMTSVYRYLAVHVNVMATDRGDGPPGVPGAAGERRCPEPHRHARTPTLKPRPAPSGPVATQDTVGTGLGHRRAGLPARGSTGPAWLSGKPA